ncbi:MAG: glycosyltransferase [Fibromonadaceae bacterium]|jgi:rhamnosyltransferase|nr:glycosyltransferase [Fibromonadaceae bacterium]
MFENIAVGITLYNPPETVWSHISFLTNLKLRVWIVDNSDAQQKNSILAGVEFYKYNANRGGLAKALNIYCEKAAELNLEWLLTLDQDSTFKSEKDLLNLLSYTQKSESDVAIIAPTLKKINSNFFAITSGTLLRMKAQKECGYYLEYFFIDALDSEYCLRLISHGWKIKIADDSMLNHKFGAMTKKYFPFYKKYIHIQEYSPERIYYVFRNQIITINLYKNRYPGPCKMYRKSLLFTIIKILLYEKSKFAKLKMALRGFLDARKIGHAEILK